MVKISSRLSATEKKQLLIIALIPVISVFIMTYVYKCVLRNNIYNQETLGQLGDFYGGILNPVITYLGLSALIYSLRYNKNLIKQNIDFDIDGKNKHNELLAQSNAVAYLNAFEYSLQYCRNNERDELRSVKLNIYKNFQNNNVEGFHGWVALINDEWGAVARYLALINSLRSIVLMDSSVVDAAVAQLKNEELEYVLICLAGINYRFGLEVADKKKQLPPSVFQVMKIVSDINN